MIALATVGTLLGLFTLWVLIPRESNRDES